MTTGSRIALLDSTPCSKPFAHPINLQRHRPSSLTTLTIPRAKNSPYRIDNTELLVGDVILLFSFTCYKQITSIIFSPSFHGWLTPLSFNVYRFLEFGSFSATIILTWISCCWISSGYRNNATSDLPTALARTCKTWLIAMPVAASQLVLLTAAEEGKWVGEEGWAAGLDSLPLAASGPGEPFVTAAGVLGLMVLWRSYYTVYLDFTNFLSARGARLDRDKDAEHFVASLQAALVLAAVGCGLIEYLNVVVGEDRLEGWMHALVSGFT
jgi:hypothetical protein